MCGLPGGWTICEIVLYAQRRALGRLDKLSCWGAKLVAQQQGFATGEIGSDCHFARQLFPGPNVRFGPKAEIEACPLHVPFTPQKRILIDGVEKSALCQKQTFTRLLDMI